MIQIGIRGNAEYLWEFSYDSGMTVIHAEAFHRLGVDETIAQMRKVVGDGPVYLSFDVDSLDPAFAPGTARQRLAGFPPGKRWRWFAGRRARHHRRRCGRGGAAI